MALIPFAEYKSQHTNTLGDISSNTFDAPVPSAHTAYYVYRIAHLTPAVVQQFTRFGMEVYCPMDEVQQTLGRKTVTRYVPRTLGYLFAYTTRDLVDSFHAKFRFRPLFTHRTSDTVLPNDRIYVTVPHSAMQVFRAIMDVTTGQADMDTPTQQQLTRGDTIRILRGPFAGIQGTLLSIQGAHQYTIHVQLAQGLGINVHVQDSDVAILAFSRQGNHVTTHLRTIEANMAPILQHYSQHHTLTQDMSTWLAYHIQRYGSLTGLTHAMAARYMVHQYLAHRLLGQHQQAQQLMDAYHQVQAADPRARRSATRTTTTAQYIQHWTTLLTKS